ncbi:MAG: aspartate carbamoyltransferase [Candidatus Altiarchaeales archaeon]|nr:aspartate carbamoyltransferase [Candidatus Altiarchaeota archaeon]MBU4266470.1 aspartate carbamoyltransferase [Candidatus Altiarchaeota archaeon]MBU4341444.1 aspartate carbamoyltransferase [Candidatus Altiarchaeota archaeon]MBU4437239.1 aspartate carbamoyltransferase [Candidatus Altiarchaeota archaeon]MCG2782542.1 aspartate carbamoyltransferase [Candidatus Altiarchaeales archaeon]
MGWTKKHIISIKDFSREEIDFVLRKSSEMEKKLNSGRASSLMRGRILATLFFEPSTRTRMSFETAMKRLGGKTVGFPFSEISSEAKGETIADTVRVVEGYADVIVIRHPVEGSARLASEYVDIPLINGGDGANQHPTQTLLDLYTIKKKFGKIDGLDIAIVGDLKYGRTVHSLTNALANYDVKLRFISPQELKMPRHMVKDLEGNKIPVKETRKLNLDDADVIYATRIQKERFPDPQEYERVKGAYVIDLKTIEGLKKSAILMHPLPRVGEISPKVDGTKFAHYFEQSKNGIPVRMALLCLVCGVKF